MTSNTTEQHATLAGLPYGKPIIIGEQTGPDEQGQECKLNHWLLKLADGNDLGATMEVAQEASRLYKADKKGVVITIEKGEGIAIRPA